jgi:hypothetical protein
MLVGPDIMCLSYSDPSQNIDNPKHKKQNVCTNVSKKFKNGHYMYKSLTIFRILIYFI